MLKTLITIKKFGKKPPLGITADQRKFSGKTITAYAVPLGITFIHFDKKKPVFFFPQHLTSLSRKDSK